jgi:hypothetical protein
MRRSALTLSWMMLALVTMLRILLLWVMVVGTMVVALLPSVLSVFQCFLLLGLPHVMMMAKFSIPQFHGNDVEEYLNWELKVEKLWRLHEYTEERKVQLASSKFEGLALIWWDHVCNARVIDRVPAIVTWCAMKEEMWHRFVPANYVRSLYDKLTNLKQGLKTVDEYFYEMEMIMQRAKVCEPEDQTMQCFLAGLSFQI